MTTPPHIVKPISRRAVLIASALVLATSVIASVIYALRPPPLEVVPIAISMSPDGRHRATLEMRVYGPGIGGAVPAIEVRVGKVEDANSTEALVYSAGEKAEIKIRWSANALLEIENSRQAEINCISKQTGTIQILLRGVSVPSGEEVTPCGTGA